jgi:hypothetical protein
MRAGKPRARVFVAASSGASGFILSYMLRHWHHLKNPSLHLPLNAVKHGLCRVITGSA